MGEWLLFSAVLRQHSGIRLAFLRKNIFHESLVTFLWVFFVKAMGNATVLLNVRCNRP